MDNGSVEDILNQATAVANEHYAYLELNTARDLIRDVFALLPWELQEDYRDIQALYRMGKFEQANRAWDAWMDNARDLGLI